MVQDVTGILRSNVSNRLPDPVAAEVIQAALSASLTLSAFRRIPMPEGQLRLPVLNALPTAYWLNPGASQNDTAAKKTSNVDWAKKTLVAEEVAVIVPIPEAVLDDAGFDVWGEVTPLLSQALGQAIDNAAIFGSNAPSSFDTVLSATVNPVNSAVKGASSAASGGIAQDINLVFGLVEADGFDVNGILAPRTFRATLRGARDTTGQKLLDMSPDGDSMLGVGVQYGNPAPWAGPFGAAGARGAAYAIAGDFSKGIVGIRRDVTYKLLDQAVLQNTDGTIGYNLPQQDMIALRVVMRMGFVIANPITLDQPTAGSRSPFATLTNA